MRSSLVCSMSPCSHSKNVCKPSLEHLTLNRKRRAKKSFSFLSCHFVFHATKVTVFDVVVVEFLNHLNRNKVSSPHTNTHSNTQTPNFSSDAPHATQITQRRCRFTILRDNVDNSCTNNVILVSSYTQSHPSEMTCYTRHECRHLIHDD